MSERDRFFRKFRITKRKVDISSYKRKRNEVNIALYKAKLTYFKTLLNENKELPREFWKTLKKIYLVKSGDGSHAKNINTDGEVTNNPVKKSNGFVSYYTSIITEIKKHLFPLNENPWRKVKSIPTKTNEKFRFNCIPRATIEYQLTKLQRSKTASLDNLTPGLLKVSAKEISSSLCYRINRPIITGVFPSSWIIVKVTSVYKSGSVNEIENYRPVSIPSVVSKKMETEIHKQFSVYLKENKFI